MASRRVFPAADAVDTEVFPLTFSLSGAILSLLEMRKKSTPAGSLKERRVAG